MTSIKPDIKGICKHAIKATLLFDFYGFGKYTYFLQKYYVTNYGFIIVTLNY